MTSRGRGTVVVNSIHAVLHELIEGSEVEPEFEAAKAGRDQAEIFNRLMPDFALHALMTGIAHQYKSLVIDEAQDMLSRPMLDVLDALVVGGLRNGRWWFFCDRNNQASVWREVTSVRSRAFASSDLMD